ncbi:hypothetical protein Tco_0478651, partial [Tanacetum coccineum]
RIAKDVKETLRSDQDFSECLNTSSMKFKESTPKKHGVKQVQQSCLEEDCWELYIPDLEKSSLDYSPDDSQKFLSFNFDFPLIVFTFVGTELITPNLICPSTHQLLRSFSGDSRPDMSFHKSASPERLFSLARASLAGDMDLYHSRLTKDDLNDLIIKYKIPRNLHPRLPFEEFVMSELPVDAIGIYHQIFDFSGIRVPFSLFLLALIKHYRVYFSQLGPLGLNKRHPSEVINDPRPAAGSFSMADVCLLSAHVIKLREMPEGVLVLSGLSRVWKSRICDLVLWGDDGNVMGIHDFLCLPKWTGVEDLVVETPSAKILAKAEAS